MTYEIRDTQIYKNNELYKDKLTKKEITDFINNLPDDIHTLHP